MRSIVEELLDLSKMEQEVDRLNFESIDMKELIEQILEMHKLSIEKKNLRSKQSSNQSSSLAIIKHVE